MNISQNVISKQNILDLKKNNKKNTFPWSKEENHNWERVEVGEDSVTAPRSITIIMRKSLLKYQLLAHSQKEAPVYLLIALIN